MSSLITIKNLEKDYPVYLNDFQKFLSFFTNSDNYADKKVQALHNINFTVEPGESIGIIGRNGSGKSTLLQILAGTLKQTGGTFSINGKVSALLELGSGFNPDFTGKDNLILNGLLMGLQKSYILEKFNEIHEFSGIGDAINQPVKTYSSGMIVRLAFAVQIIRDPEILIVDEALSVGDFFFQQKCFNHVSNLLKKGTSLLLVSHDMGMIRNYCNKVIYLDKGNLIDIGEPKDVINNYLNNNKEDRKGINSLKQKKISDRSYESGKIINYNIGNAKKDMIYKVGDKLKLEIIFSPNLKRRNNISINIKNIYDELITAFGTNEMNDDILTPEEQCVLNFKTEIDLSLEAGRYSIEIYLGIKTGVNKGDKTDMKTIPPIQLDWDYDNDPVAFTGKVGLKVNKEINIIEYDG